MLLACCVRQDASSSEAEGLHQSRLFRQFSRDVQRADNKISRYPRFRHADGKPAAHVLIQTDAVHVVVERLVEGDAEYGVVDTGWVDEFDIVGGKSDRG